MNGLLWGFRKRIISTIAFYIFVAFATKIMAQSSVPPSCGTFTVAVIPDTQNYVDYRDQKSAGFPINSVDLFFEEISYIAQNAKSSGGEIAFATALGDLKQHYSLWMDPDHAARGFKGVPNNPTSEVAAGPRKEAITVEMPYAVAGYRMLKGKLPFSIVPGNHDYDALWTDAKDPPQLIQGKMSSGNRIIGGLSSFTSAFSDESEFFKNQPWYVDSHDEGADSAQIFSAGNCRFLHIGLQFVAPDDSLAWAARVIKRFPGVPTIISIHGFLDRTGARNSNFNASVNPGTNDPQMIWDKFISQNDQIFLVLNGHICGQSYRVDANTYGHEVHQLLSDYQCRGQVAKDMGVDLKHGPGADWIRGSGIGDGWLRLMMFNLDRKEPTIHVRTYSTFYRKFSTDIEGYASWYKRADDQAKLSDEDFDKRDDFTITLKDYRARFDVTKSVQ